MATAASAKSASVITRETFEEIARAIGKNWIVIEYQEVSDRTYAVLGDDRGVWIGCSFNGWNNENRFAFTHEYDYTIEGKKYQGQSWDFDRRDFTITVTAKKSPEKIASDIKKRLLPEYTPLRLKMVENFHEQHERQKYRNAIADRLFALIELERFERLGDLDVYSEFDLDSRDNKSTLKKFRFKNDDLLTVEFRLNPRQAIALLENLGEEDGQSLDLRIQLNPDRAIALVQLADRQSDATL